MGHDLLPINPPQWTSLTVVWHDERQSAVSTDVRSTWKQWRGRSRCKSSAACPTGDVLPRRARGPGPPTTGGKMKPWTNNGRHLRTALKFMSERSVRPPWASLSRVGLSANIIEGLKRRSPRVKPSYLSGHTLLSQTALCWYTSD